MTTEEFVVNKLINRGWKIAFAESCTGGMCASRLVDVASASWVLNESIVTYANEAKIKYLGVKKETIDKYNVVSEEVAYEMAIGIKSQAKSNIGIGITGAAGPTSDGVIPIGNVCIGFAIENEVFVTTLRLGNVGRNNVRKMATDYVFEYLNEALS